MRRAALYPLHLATPADFATVWFVYPETANVRLEDMNSLFGDANTTAPTPATLAEVESLFSAGGTSLRSPVPEFHLADDGDADAVPRMDLGPSDAPMARQRQAPGPPTQRASPAGSEAWWPVAGRRAAAGSTDACSSGMSMG